MIKKFVGDLLLKILGWKIQGNFPALNKCVVVGAPHTSQWDFVFAVLFSFSEKSSAKFFMKKELFVFPLKGLLKLLGGIPVNRQSKNNLVQDMVDRFNTHEKFILALTPEGTRSKVNDWKSGFYRIAVGANVPIVLAYMDYAKKNVGVKKIFEPTGDYEKDLTEIKEVYKTVTPKYPEKYAL